MNKPIRTMREFAEALIRLTEGWDKDDPRWDDIAGILEFNELLTERRIAARKTK